MALKIRCKDERGEVKNECGVRVILWMYEELQSMRAGGEANRIEGAAGLMATGLLSL